MWIKRYYTRCFLQNPDGEWSGSSCSAGWDLVRVFITLWDNKTVPRELLHELQAWIEGLYKNGDNRLRTCIVHATLEHLFEREPIRKYFVEWRNDATLAIMRRVSGNKKTPLSR